MKSIAALILLLCAAIIDITDAAASPVNSLVKPLSTFGGYKVIFRSGDQPGDSPLPIGTLIDINGNPVIAELVCTSVGCSPPKTEGDAVADISANPDFTSLQTLPSGKIFLLTQFEASSPAAFYVTELSQNKLTGELTAVKSMPTNWSAPELQGLWTPCAGSVTPWGTHSGGEVYEPDAFCVELATSINGTEATSLKACLGDASAITEFMRFYGYYSNTITLQAIKTLFNPYLYGHGFEVELLDDAGSTKISKHFAMGRHSFKMWYAMPDQKTVYSTDDGENTAFWKFVANTAGDMSAGTLYGAKLTQLSDVYGGEFNISWINLGHGTQAEVETMMLTDKITFSQIFDTAVYSAAVGCADGYKSISRRDNTRGASCLKLKPGMEKAAAFLESRRYLAYMGGTVELSKFEGITHEKTTGKLYASMSQIRNGMENNSSKGKASQAYDEGGSNDVRLPHNPCGCIYAFDLTPNFDVTRMYGELCGVPHATTARYGVSRCDERSIAEPDNVVNVGTQGTLIIGEDTNENQMDSMWSYDLSTKLLTRIFTSPYGAETTAPYWFPNTKGRFNGWSYMGASIQHPYGESDQSKASEPEANGRAGYVGAWAFSAKDFARGEKLLFVGIPPSTTNTMRHKVIVSSSGYTLPHNRVYGSHPEPTSAAIVRPINKSKIQNRKFAGCNTMKITMVDNLLKVGYFFDPSSTVCSRMGVKPTNDQIYPSDCRENQRECFYVAVDGLEGAVGGEKDAKCIIRMIHKDHQSPTKEFFFTVRMNLCGLEAGNVEATEVDARLTVVMRKGSVSWAPASAEVTAVNEELCNEDCGSVDKTILSPAVMHGMFEEEPEGLVSTWKPCTEAGLMRVVNQICLYTLNGAISGIKITWQSKNINVAVNPDVLLLGATATATADSTKCLNLRVEQNERIKSIVVAADNIQKYINFINITTNGDQVISAGTNKGTIIEVSTNSGRFQVASGFLCGITGNVRSGKGMEHQGWLQSLQFNFLMKIADGALTNLTWFAEDMTNDGTSSLGHQTITLVCSSPSLNIGDHTLKYTLKKDTEVSYATANTFGHKVGGKFSYNFEKKVDKVKVSMTQKLGFETSYEFQQSTTTTETQKYLDSSAQEMTLKVNLICPSYLTVGSAYKCTWSFKSDMIAMWSLQTYKGFWEYVLYSRELNQSGKIIRLEASGATSGTWTSSTFNQEGPKCIPQIDIGIGRRMLH